jgi:hypothetical protein
VKVSAKPALKPTAHVSKAAVKAPARPAARPAPIRAAEPVKTSHAPKATKASLRKAVRTAPALTKAAPRATKAVLHAPPPKPKSSLPKPLRALNNFLQRVTHPGRQAQAPVRVAAQVAAQSAPQNATVGAGPSHPAHPSAIRVVAIGRPHAVDRRAEPGSWVDCRRPRGGEEAKLCQAVEGDGTLGGQLRQAARGAKARSVEDPG